MFFGRHKRKWMMGCLFIYLSNLSAHIIEVIPFSPDSKQTLFNDIEGKPYDSLLFWDQVQYKLKEKGYIVRTTDLSDVPKKRKKIDKYLPWKRLKKNVDKVIVLNMPYYLHSQKIFNLSPKKTILLMMEPPTIVPEQYNMPKMKKHFHKIFTFDDSLVDNKTVFQFYYPVCNVTESQKMPFNQKKLLCTISANKNSPHHNELYTERKKAIEFFEDKSEGIFDLYGTGWETENYKNYKGTIPTKIEVMKNYKFSICYENIYGIRGYITEKIFDSFEAGCVPVYLGAENVTDYIPANCFIDKRNFATYEELLTFLESIDESTYMEYIRNIDLFLSSEKGQKYNPQNFINLIVNAANS